jgi:hypothetical protein
VDLEAALYRGFSIAFTSALVGSLASQLALWMYAPISWETARMPFQIVVFFVGLSALTSLVVGILVFFKRACEVSCGLHKAQ